MIALSNACIHAVVKYPSSPHVLVGTPFKITDATSNNITMDCSFLPDSTDSSEDTWPQDGGKPETESVHYLHGQGKFQK